MVQVIDWCSWWFLCGFIAYYVSEIGNIMPMQPLTQYCWITLRNQSILDVTAIGYTRYTLRIAGGSIMISALLCLLSRGDGSVTNMLTYQSSAYVSSQHETKPIMNKRNKGALSNLVLAWNKEPYLMYHSLWHLTWWSQMVERGICSRWLVIAYSSVFTVVSKLQNSIPSIQIHLGIGTSIGNPFVKTLQPSCFHSGISNTFKATSLYQMRGTCTISSGWTVGKSIVTRARLHIA